jgi:single-strand DNA-binding protein
MASLNKVSLIGYLGKDPDTQFLSSGSQVTKFSLATSRPIKDKEPVTEWHNIVAFGKLAEICSSYLAKGSLVYIEGRIQYRSWEDKEGNKKYITEIFAKSLQMLDRKKEVGKSEHDPSTDEDVPF